WVDTRGRSMRTEWVSSGAVTMKITSSTSMTSISGIMLISASGAPDPLLSLIAGVISERSGGRRPRGIETAMRRFRVRRRLAGGDRADEPVGKAREARHGHPVGANQAVVAEHGRDRDRKAERRHDERLAHWPRDLVERALAGDADAHQRVV